MTLEADIDWTEDHAGAAALGRHRFKALSGSEQRELLIKVGALTPDGQVAPAFREAVLRKRAGEAAE